MTMTRWSLSFRTLLCTYYYDSKNDDITIIPSTTYTQKYYLQDNVFKDFRMK